MTHNYYTENYGLENMNPTNSLLTHGQEKFEHTKRISRSCKLKEDIQYITMVKRIRQEDQLLSTKLYTENLSIHAFMAHKEGGPLHRIYVNPNLVSIIEKKKKIPSCHVPDVANMHDMFYHSHIFVSYFRDFWVLHKLLIELDIKYFIIVHLCMENVK